MDAPEPGGGAGEASEVHEDGREEAVAGGGRGQGGARMEEARRKRPFGGTGKDADWTATKKGGDKEGWQIGSKKKGAG